MTGYKPYSLRPGWEDLSPISQTEGPDPLSPIAYSAEYKDAMDMFRALINKGEKSARALELTDHIVRLNPAHYSVWAYRSEVLFALRSDLTQELISMEDLIKEHLKSYQVWQHRRNVVTVLNDHTRELPFISRALAEDHKNYHTWAYRQWVLCHFENQQPEIWDGELLFVEGLLSDDCRNNSAWNHRWVCSFERGLDLSEVKEREIVFCQDQLKISPNNPSAWNYLRGVLQRTKSSYSTVTDFVQSLIVGKPPVQIPPLAVEFLADALAEEVLQLGPGKSRDVKTSEAFKHYELLARQLDPVRERYWNYKKSRLILSQ